MKKKSFLIVLGVCIGTTGFVWGANDKPLYKNPDALSKTVWKIYCTV